MADPTPSIDAAIFSLNTPDDGPDANDIEDPVNGPLSQKHHLPKGKSRAGSMNDPFPEMFVAKPWKPTGGHVLSNSEPDDGVLYTPGAHRSETGFGTK